jgi:hypothetical protein
MATITQEQLTDIASESDVTETTVLRRLAGLKVMPRLARRIDAALSRHGVAVPQDATNPGT